MSSPAPFSDAVKFRIISHMNNDHQAELRNYLQHYASVPASACQSPLLLDVTNTTMTVQSSPGQTYTIVLSPPITTLSEFRATAIAMDAEARFALSPPILDHYIPPKPAHAIVMFLVIYFFANVVLYPFIVPGNWFYDRVLCYFPGGPGLYKWLLRMIWQLVVAIHIGESWWLDRKLLRVGVKRGSPIWWAWVVSCFFEGFGAHLRVAEWKESKKAEIVGVENGKKKGSGKEKGQ